MICCFRAEAGKLSEELPPRRRNIRLHWAQHSAPVAPEAGGGIKADECIGIPG